VNPSPHPVPGGITGPLSRGRQTVGRKLTSTSVKVKVTLRLTVSQSVSQYVLVSSTLVGLATRYYFLSECCCLVSMGLSLMRGRVCNLQCNHSTVRVAQNPKSYFTVSSEAPPTWRARFPYSYPPGVAQLYPRALGSLYVVSYDLQGYGGDILTLPLPGGTGPCIYSLQE
jgi:hypothetical protein